MGAVDEHTAWRVSVCLSARRLVAELATTDPHDTRTVLERFAGTLTAPPDRRHSAMLAALLLDLCVRIVEALHRCDAKRCDCRTAAWSQVGGLIPWRRADPCAAFRTWLGRVVSNFEREHPPSVASRAAACVRNDPAKRWTVSALAAAAGSRPGRLRCDFRRRFDLRPTEYVGLVRAADAIARLGSAAKVEAVAWEVGYRSKKDLYAALKRWTGASPAELRACSDAEREWLQRQLQARAAGSPGAAAPTGGAGIRIGGGVREPRVGDSEPAWQPGCLR